mgnify:CR=1 FL=1
MLSGFALRRHKRQERSWSQTLGTNNEIIRNKKDIPHIFAENTADAAFALGFAHAQDRLWQMEFMHRIGAGRLSEIIGPETLATDKFLRALGIYRLAEKQAETLPTDVSETLDAYVLGVNAFIENHDGAWPIEFVILGHCLLYTSDAADD